MFEKANKPLIIITLILLMLVIVPIILIPNSVVSFLSLLYKFITTDLAWFFLFHVNVLQWL